MKKIMCSIIIVLMMALTGCSALTANVPSIGEVEVESDYNIKIYTDVDYKYKPDGSILIDDTTIFYLNSDMTVQDMDEIRRIFDSRYDVYERALK